MSVPVEPRAALPEAVGTAARRDFADTLPSTLEDWLRMVAIGCSMAGSHEAETRSTRFAQALYAAGNATPDRGMLDPHLRRGPRAHPGGRVMGGTGWTGTRIVPGDWKSRRAAVLDRAGGLCQSCGFDGPLEVDHIINVAEGGTHELDNLQALCPPCHSTKTKEEQRRGHARRSQRRRDSKGERHPGIIR